MKKLLYQIQSLKLLPTRFVYILSLAAFSLSACSDFLAEDPKAFISSDAYYRNVADAKSAVAASYYWLNASNGQTFYNILGVTGQEFMADEIFMGPGATNPDVKAQSTLDHSPSTLRVKEIWQQHYQGIMKANIAIDKIPGIKPATDAEKTLLEQYVAEAKFIRALYYFNLVRLYGSVPLVLHEVTTLDKEALLVSRTPAEKVYKQVIEDFEEAAKVLPWYYPSGSADAGRANGGAAEAFLALAYLTLANVSLDDDLRAANISVIPNRDEYLEKSIKHAENVFRGGYYDLFDDYADVFKKQSKNGIEHLFSGQHSSATLANGNGFGNRTAPLGIKAINGIFADVPTQELVNLLLSHENDKRIPVTITRTYTVDNVTYTIDPAQNQGFSYASYKYFDSDVPTKSGQSGINVPIIRFAEVLLNHAEARNERFGGGDAGAYNSYNQVRRRAGISEFLPGSLSQDQLRDSLYLERRLELNFEYHRWFDLIREIDAAGNHILVKTLQNFGKPSARDKHYLYPIPQIEIGVNPKLEQQTLWK